MSSTKHSHRKQVNAGVRYRIIELTSGPVGYAASPNGLKRVFLPGLSASALEREILREFPDAKRDQRLLPDFAETKPPATNTAGAEPEQFALQPSN